MWDEKGVDLVSELGWEGLKGRFSRHVCSVGMTLLVGSFRLASTGKVCFTVLSSGYTVRRSPRDVGLLGVKG